VVREYRRVHVVKTTARVPLRPKSVIKCQRFNGVQQNGRKVWPTVIMGGHKEWPTVIMGGHKVLPTVVKGGYRGKREMRANARTIWGTASLLLCMLQAPE
jgi:hypothetical protein